MAGMKHSKGIMQNPITIQRGRNVLKKLLPLVLKIALVIFFVEAIVMAILSAVAIADKNIEGLVDSITLTLLSALLIYYWIIKSYVEARDVAEEALHLSDTVFDITDMGILLQQSFSSVHKNRGDLLYVPTTQRMAIFVL